MNAYTCEIQKGQSFKNFTLRCVRAFMIEMRDMPFDTPIPDKFEGDKSYKDSMEDSIECHKTISLHLDEIKNNPEKLELCVKERNEERIRKIEDLRKINKNKLELKKKYTAMIKKVMVWKCPSAKFHELRKFMLNQLRGAIEFDCRTTSIQDVEITKEDYITELSRKKFQYANDVKYYKEKYEESVQNAKEWTLWMKQLKESIK